MAQRTLIELIDDIDGTEATETVTFDLDNVTYEIDLNDKNAGDLRSALEPYTAAARRVRGRGRSRQRRPAASTPTSNTAEVRDWARSNGYTVSDRGRVPAEVQKAYDAAS